MAAETDTPDPTSSLLAFFGSELRRVRLAEGKSQSETAKLAHTTQAMISYVESAKRVPSEELARDLDLAFGTGGHFGRLYPLVIKFAYPSWFLPFVQFERDASSIRSFQPQVIPGLLQTEEYAREVLASGRPDSLDDLLAARMTRQDLFERDTPPRTWFVMDDYALTRAFMPPKIMKGQFQHLLQAADRPRTVIQVVPRDAPPHPGLAGPFTLLSFDEGSDVLHVDGYSQGWTVLDAGRISEAAHAYDLIRATALSPRASADLINTYLKELAT
ncbi:helix-turn-helix domain-containing protein [Streptomyces caatingaensis]|uniref:XRE family transcriptional regulator n=1 Tax=Streptomyces caatingaensis TaxID=1678637 RepID=A0A0K9XIM1_9ACTN|nr:helix-turn-helix transcriptional regulator [Streptomyces caatingaensis]KNB52911.1 XRE family transcriptional regulator [Streptomyces caatingaensis]